MKNMSFWKLLAIQLLAIVIGFLFLLLLRLIGVDPLSYAGLYATKAFGPDSLFSAVFVYILFILFLSFFSNVALECFDHSSRKSPFFKRKILIHVLNFVGLMLLYSMSLLIIPVIEDGIFRWVMFGVYVLTIYTLIFKENVIQKGFEWIFKRNNYEKEQK